MQIYAKFFCLSKINSIVIETPWFGDAPRPFQWEFQLPASWQMLGIIDLYFDLMSVLVSIAIFVLFFIYSPYVFLERHFSLHILMDILYRYSLLDFTKPVNDFVPYYSEGVGFYARPLIIAAPVEVPENWAEGVWTRACPHPETDRFVRRCLGVVAKFAFFQPHVYFSHWAMLEFLWTLVPCVILVFIAVPSFALVLALDQGFKPVLWIKVIGNQWFWTYECSTYSSTPSLVSFESVMTPDSELKDNYLRLLSVDNILTIPCLKPVRFLVTSNDVIHSWTVPSMGLKIDAVPGRINMANLLCMRPGIYYGQCSEICGVNHAFMPIAVSVILPRK